MYTSPGTEAVTNSTPHASPKYQPTYTDVGPKKLCGPKYRKYSKKQTPLSATVCLNDVCVRKTNITPFIQRLRTC